MRTNKEEVDNDDFSWLDEILRVHREWYGSLAELSDLLTWPQADLEEEA